jgi:hypothetical protein
MNNKNTVYANFPICLLAEKDIKIVVKNALDYACYSQSKRLNLGTDKYRDSMKYYLFSEISPEMAFDSQTNGQRIYELYNHSTHAGIKVDTLWNYYFEEKSSEDIIAFRAQCATKAVVGTKRFAKTNKEQIVSKMFGVEKTSQIVEGENLKYLERYQFVKLISELEKHWYLKYVSNHSRGCFISYKISLADLMFEVERLKLNSKIGTVNPVKQTARMQAKKKLSDYLNNAES